MASPVVSYLEIVFQFIIICFSQFVGEPFFRIESLLFCISELKPSYFAQKQGVSMFNS